MPVTWQNPQNGTLHDVMVSVALQVFSGLSKTNHVFKYPWQAPEYPSWVGF
jgi:hypothetical protein